SRGRVPGRRGDRARRRPLRLATRPLALTEFLSTLGNFDTQLYLAIAAQRNIVISIVAVALTYLNWNGFYWWILALLLLHSRGLTRRGIAATGTVVLALVDAWWVTELLKLVVRRPRPFDALTASPQLLPAPETSIPPPSTSRAPS